MWSQGQDQWQNKETEGQNFLAKSLLIFCVLKLIPLVIILKPSSPKWSQTFFNHSCKRMLLQNQLTWQLTSFLTSDFYLWVEQSTWHMLSSDLEAGWAEKELVGHCEMERLQERCINPAQTTSWLIEPVRGNNQGSPQNIWCTWFAGGVMKPFAGKCLWAPRLLFFQCPPGTWCAMQIRCSAQDCLLWVLAWGLL